MIDTVDCFTSIANVCSSARPELYYPARSVHYLHYPLCPTRLCRFSSPAPAVVSASRQPHHSLQQATMSSSQLAHNTN